MPQSSEMSLCKCTHNMGVHITVMLHPIPAFSPQPVDMLLVSGNLSGSSEA